MLSVLLLCEEEDGAALDEGACGERLGGWLIIAMRMGIQGERWVEGDVPNTPRPRPGECWMRSPEVLRCSMSGGADIVERRKVD